MRFPQANSQPFHDFRDGKVSDPTKEAEAQLDDISVVLDEGLKSCQHVVAEYRSLLGSALATPTSIPSPANDQDDAETPLT